jgi:hypothetical protein
LVGVSSFLISTFGTGENFSKKENLTEILLMGTFLNCVAKTSIPLLQAAI